MAAAIYASELGLSVVLIDEQARAGGQIYRNVGIADATVKKLLGPDYTAGGGLVSRLNRSSVDVCGATIWMRDARQSS